MSDVGEIKKELRAYVGPRASYYLRRWFSTRAGWRSLVDWNWPAFLFAGFWLAYRRMYATAAALFGVFFVEEFIERLLVHGGNDRAAALLAWLANIVGTMLPFVCALWGNRWYHRRAARAIERAKAEGLRDRDLRRHLARRGGTSTLAPVALLVLLVLIAVAWTFLEPSP